MNKVDTKLKLKSDPKRWYPASIDDLRTHLGSYIVINGEKVNEKEIRSLSSNIAYNLQYVEFLDRIIRDINLSEVLKKQSVKSFIIYSASIIEAIFYYLLKVSGNAKISEWKSYKKLKTNEYEINGLLFKNEIEVFLKLDQSIEEEMTFDQMSKMVEKRKLLGEAEDLYKKISRVRKLRNKVHIHGARHMNETDYNSFSESEFRLTREVLYGVLTAPIFSTSKMHGLFNYLNNEE